MATFKFATPGTVVRGASLRRNPETFEPITDNRGRPIWDMPEPFGTHTTKQVAKVGGKKTMQDVQFSVYRGLDASLARYFRAQLRRFYCLEADKIVEQTLNPILEIEEDDTTAPS